MKEHLRWKFKGHIKIFELENYNRISKYKLENLTNHSYAEFEKVFSKELNKHAPLKKKILRHDNNAFMTKALWKEIILGSKPKNKFNKKKIISFGAIISVSVIIA